MDTTTLITEGFNNILPLLPAKYAANGAVISAFVVSTCTLIRIFWGKPSDGSKLLPLYNIIDGLAGNINKNKDSK